MKATCLIALMALASTLTAQFQFAVKAGLSPNTRMGTSPMIVNRNDQTSDFLFNGNRVEYSPAIGVATRLKMQQFFVEAEAFYYAVHKSYNMEYISIESFSHPLSVMSESCKNIEFPISIGAAIGKFEISSGLSTRLEFGRASSFSQIQGFNEDMRGAVLGWHGGVAMNLGKMSVQLRYQQDFSNYGKGLFVNGKELLLGNAPSQLRCMVGFWF